MPTRVIFSSHSREPEVPDFINHEALAQAHHYHASLPGYEQTPLHGLPFTAAALGVGMLWVKDESSRFGLESFKALGASHAMWRLTKAHTEKHPVFATATDGNHGRGVAWAAARHGWQAIIHMPKGSAPARVDAIQQLGAECVVTDKNYDDTVAALHELAQAKGWIVVQDTAWPGYEKIPQLIMQGYGTIIRETVRQLEATRSKPPTHIFLQAGVGSFAAAIIAAVALYLPEFPQIIIVEPQAADCFYRSLAARTRVCVQGELNTIMAGLACGRPSSLAWPIIRSAAACAISCEDEIARNGMRLLYNNTDTRIIAGESGAATAGALAWLMTRPEALRHKLGLDANARILLINTEGATNPDSWQKTVAAS